MTELQAKNYYKIEYKLASETKYIYYLQVNSLMKQNRNDSYLHASKLVENFVHKEIAFYV